MDPNRLTEKSQEALRAAQSLAARLSNQQVDAEHLLVALLEQESGIAATYCSSPASNSRTCTAV